MAWLSCREKEGGCRWGPGGGRGVTARGTLPSASVFEVEVEVEEEEEEEEEVEEEEEIEVEVEVEVEEEGYVEEEVEEDGMHVVVSCPRYRGRHLQQREHQ